MPGLQRQGTPMPLVISAVPAATTIALSREGGTCGARLIDGQRPAFKCLTVQAVDRALHVFALRQLNETESSRRPRKFVLNHRRRRHTEAGTRDALIEAAVR